MRLFSESTKALNAIQKAATLVGEFPASPDREQALTSLADAGAHALRASAGCVLRQPQPCEATAEPVNPLPSATYVE